MDISQIEFKLEEIGLTKSEVKVYISLLELGPSTTGPIVDKSKTANSKIYLILEKLIDKGLVTYFKQEVLRYYKAAPPSQIIRYLKEKQEKLRSQEKEVEKIFPILESLSKQKEEEKEAIVFRGPKAIKTAFNDLVDSLRKGEEVNIMGVYNFGEEFRRLALYFQKIRSKKGIKANFLMNSNARPLAKKFREYPPLEVRFMGEGTVTPSIFLIYKDKVIINLGDEMVFFMIKSKSTADSFNVYFKQ